MTLGGLPDGIVHLGTIQKMKKIIPYLIKELLRIAQITKPALLERALRLYSLIPELHCPK